MLSTWTEGAPALCCRTTCSSTTPQTTGEASEASEASEATEARESTQFMHACACGMRRQEERSKRGHVQHTCC